MNTIRNHVQIVGYLGKNPEIKEFGKSKKASFSLGCNESYTDKEGRRVQNTSWFNVVAWNALATTAEKYISKGDRVTISGKLVNRDWTDKEGKKHYITEIVMNDILLDTQKRDQQ